MSGIYKEDGLIFIAMIFISFLFKTIFWLDYLYLPMKI